MRILFAYTNSLGNTRKRGGQTLLEDLSNLPTTHMSEVNHLLICHWLREWGHDITLLATCGQSGGNHHFRSVTVSDLDPSNFDVLMLFKIQGLKTAQTHGLFRHTWGKIVAWLDVPYPENILGRDALSINSFAWGTPEILALSTPLYPTATHTLCEHATIFPTPPTLGTSEPRGLYAGRLPQEYLRQVLLAASVSPMLVYALWVEVGGIKTLLRPSQYHPEDLDRVRGLLPSLTLYPGVNLITETLKASSAAFGLCPAAAPPGHQQILSASKFYDYLALGLPVVLADSTPESCHVRAFPHLGELYTQGNPNSLQGAIHRALHRAQTRTFPEERRHLQDWVFSRATYRHRAEVLHGLVR